MRRKKRKSFHSQRARRGGLERVEALEDAYRRGAVAEAGAPAELDADVVGLELLLAGARPEEAHLEQRAEALGLLLCRALNVEEKEFVGYGRGGGVIETREAMSV